MPSPTVGTHDPLSTKMSDALRPVPDAPAPPAPPSSRHLPALDGVRGIAILMVMLLHFTTVLVLPAGSAAAPLRYVFMSGGWGVDLFFALSGFLITGILLDAKGTEGYFRTFYARRVLRIFPLYYLILALYFFGAWRVAGPAHHIPANQQLWYWGFLGNFEPLPWESRTMIGHLWSLGIEEQFYLVWPLTIFLCSRQRLLKVCLIGAVVALVSRTLVLYVTGDVGLAYHWTPGRVDGLALGAVVAILLRDPRGLAGLKRWTPWVASLASTVLTAAVLSRRPFDFAEHTTSFLMMTVGYSAIAMLCAATVAWVVAAGRTSRLSRAASVRPLIVFGRYSYAIYMLHPALLRVATKVGAAPSPAALAAHPFAWLLVFPGAMMAVSLAAGVTSWHAFEKHFLRLKHHFEYQQAAGNDRPALISGPDGVVAPTRSQQVAAQFAPGPAHVEG